MTQICFSAQAAELAKHVELLELDFSMARIRLQRIGIVLQWNRRFNLRAAAQRCSIRPCHAALLLQDSTSE